MTYTLGERENHFKVYCPNIIVEHCIFPDCKTYEEMKREKFESHLINECGSKFKQCKTCDLDIYKFYENDAYREASKGHLCERDCMMFLAECILDGNREDERAGKEESLADFGGISVDESMHQDVKPNAAATPDPTFVPSYSNFTTFR